MATIKLTLEISFGLMSLDPVQGAIKGVLSEEVQELGLDYGRDRHGRGLGRDSAPRTIRTGQLVNHQCLGSG